MAVNDLVLFGKRGPDIAFYTPRERGQHLSHRVQYAAGSGFLTVADIKCDVGAILGECLAIGLFAVVGGGHKNDALLLIDLIKEAPIADPVAPSRRGPIFQSLDIRTGVRALAKNRVNILTELGFEPPL
jgi:hypothetical protein